MKIAVIGSTGGDGRLILQEEATRCEHDGTAFARRAVAFAEVAAEQRRAALPRCRHEPGICSASRDVKVLRLIREIAKPARDSRYARGATTRPPSPRRPKGMSAAIRR
jgi:uncharacterized protein YbjT (DUF2867 family)